MMESGAVTTTTAPVSSKAGESNSSSGLCQQKAMPSDSSPLSPLSQARVSPTAPGELFCYS